jgi:ferrous iron transport protein B
MGTDWVNDNLFDEGYHLFGIGASAYDEAAEEYAPYASAIEAFEAAAEEQSIDIETASVNELAKIETSYDVVNEETGEIEETVPVSYIDYQKALKIEEPDHADYGVWVPSIPDLVGGWLDALGCAEWLRGLIIDGIIGGVGAVLGFLPQMLVLFFFLAFLEGCGYMARVAFIMDRIFRKFGLSGKSFIPMLIGAGCGVPAVMASRTIENERDRRMTIMTTTFIPCGAKLPIIALIAGALFGGAPWVAPSAYFIGVAAIIVSGIMLKKTRMFAGDPAPFVMELPAYHMPTIGSIFRSMWERAWSFIKKAGTVILLSAIVLWFLQAFGFTSEGFGMVDDLNDSILANIGNTVAWIFNPLGWGDWKAAVATVTGLIAKENVVGTFGVLYGVGEVAEDGAEIWGSMQQNFSAISGFSFLIFNLLCAPCFAAIGAIKREMNSAKWTWFAIGYQCGFAYAVSLIVYQIGSAIQGNINPIGLAAAVVLLAFFGFMLFRPYKESNKLTQKIKVK